MRGGGEKGKGKGGPKERRKERRAATGEKRRVKGDASARLGPAATVTSSSGLGGRPGRKAVAADSPTSYRRGSAGGSALASPSAPSSASAFDSASASTADSSAFASSSASASDSASASVSASSSSFAFAFSLFLSCF
ncbi:uncharacterized protein LOC127745450 [Arachis duranensis]|uniref:Uncharacterized protein LOC127745450 n=1 Tax=Arachis duranensis TaxID=130453 RepID=A0A9C6TNY7_ARADU|nr:uncharacterized protein LOC127745450 [Arachis duranensis]